MRFAIILSYNGAHFEGWQVQPGRSTVQAAVQTAIKTICRQEIDLVGCGRTDAGVHAKKYVAHFDLTTTSLPTDFIYHLNAVLPGDIAAQHITQVDDQFHARYDAVSRTYEYYIHGFKSPFIDNLSYRYKQFDKLSIENLQAAADLLLPYEHFFPFCISNSGVNNYAVKIHSVQWELIETERFRFTITANRFLRGMVRLITGMCIHVAIGQVTKEEVIQALQNQTLLPKSLSIPAHGLYLTKISYGSKGGENKF